LKPFLEVNVFAPLLKNTIYLASLNTSKSFALDLGFDGVDKLCNGSNEYKLAFGSNDLQFKGDLKEDDIVHLSNYKGYKHDFNDKARC
jgi:hypothetical protein